MSANPNATSKEESRPLSPHLQIWRWHATMATSILHRASGTANYIGAILFTVFLVILAGGEDAVASISFLFEGPLGWITRAALFGLTLAYSYHWLSGLRHLIWDTGRGFAPGTANTVSYLMFAGTPILAVGLWVLAYGVAS